VRGGGFSARSGAEVDFVLEAGGRFQLFEAKTASEPGSDAMRGFRAFERAYGEQSVVQRTIVCRTDVARTNADGVALVGPASMQLFS